MSYDPDREGEFITIADAARDEMKGIEGLLPTCRQPLRMRQVFRG